MEKIETNPPDKILSKMEHQDWNPVVVRGKNPSGPTTRQTKPRVSGEAAHLAKVEREEFIKSKILSPESRKDLVAARLVLKKTQVELDRQCAFPTNTIREFEAGKLTPNSSQLNRLNRELKISLKLS